MMDKIILKYFELALFLFIFIISSCSTKNQKIVKSDNTINVNIEKNYIISKGNFSEILGDIEYCYLSFDYIDQDESETTKKIALDLISSYLVRIERVGLSGVSMKECMLNLTYVISNSVTQISLHGKGFNSSAESEEFGVDGFRHALLKNILHLKPEIAILLCGEYDVVLPECENYLVEVDSSVSRHQLIPDGSYSIKGGTIRNFSTNELKSSTVYRGDLNYKIIYNEKGSYTIEKTGIGAYKKNGSDWINLSCQNPYTEYKVNLNLNGEQLSLVPISRGTCPSNNGYLRVTWNWDEKYLIRGRIFNNGNNLFYQEHKFIQMD